MSKHTVRRASSWSIAKTHRIANSTDSLGALVSFHRIRWHEFGAHTLALARCGRVADLKILKDMAGFVWKSVYCKRNSRFIGWSPSCPWNGDNWGGWGVYVAPTFRHSWLVVIIPAIIQQPGHACIDWFSSRRSWSDLELKAEKAGKGPQEMSEQNNTIQLVAVWGSMFFGNWTGHDRTIKVNWSIWSQGRRSFVISIVDTVWCNAPLGRATHHNTSVTTRFLKSRS